MQQFSTRWIKKSRINLQQINFLRNDKKLRYDDWWVRLADIIARKENEKLACEKFLARNEVREMREIRGYKFVHSYPFPPIFWTKLINFLPQKREEVLIHCLIVKNQIKLDQHGFLSTPIDCDWELKHFCWCKFWVSLPLNLNVPTDV